MQAEKLFLHVTDTIKEWELKLGTGDTDMKLYYPEQSLAILLGLREGYSREEFRAALSAFCREAAPMLGDIRVLGEGRVCLDIPPEGCRYVAERVPAPAFLTELLALMRQKGADLAAVRDLFARWAQKKGTHFLEREDAHDGVGHIFYFEDAVVDPYMYCVTQDDFGLAYHRFGREDFAQMEKEGVIEG